MLKKVSSMFETPEGALRKFREDLKSLNDSLRRAEYDVKAAEKEQKSLYERGIIEARSGNLQRAKSLEVKFKLKGHTVAQKKKKEAQLMRSICATELYIAKLEDAASSDSAAVVMKRVMSLAESKKVTERLSKGDLDGDELTKWLDWQLEGNFSDDASELEEASPSIFEQIVLAENSGDEDVINELKQKAFNGLKSSVTDGMEI